MDNSSDPFPPNRSPCFRSFSRASLTISPMYIPEIIFSYLGTKKTVKDYFLQSYRERQKQIKNCRKQFIHEIVQMNVHVYSWSIDYMNSFEYDDGKHEKRKTLRFSSFLKFLLGKELSNNFLNSIKLTFDLHLSAWVNGVFVHLSVILGLDKV